MLYAIFALDKEGSQPARLENYSAHHAHLSQAEEYGAKIVVSGPLTKGNEDTIIGSLLIIEEENCEAVERFNSDDPFKRAGIWDRVTIAGFIKRQDNR